MKSFNHSSQLVYTHLLLISYSKCQFIAICVLHSRFTSLACPYDRNSITRIIIVYSLKFILAPSPFVYFSQIFQKLPFRWRFPQQQQHHHHQLSRLEQQQQKQQHSSCRKTTTTTKRTTTETTTNDRNKFARRGRRGGEKPSRRWQMLQCSELNASFPSHAAAPTFRSTSMSANSSSLRRPILPLPPRLPSLTILLRRRKWKRH